MRPDLLLVTSFMSDRSRPRTEARRVPQWTVLEEDCTMSLCDAVVLYFCMDSTVTSNGSSTTSSHVVASWGTAGRCNLVAFTALATWLKRPPSWPQVSGRSDEPFEPAFAAPTTWWKRPPSLLQGVVVRRHRPSLLQAVAGAGSAAHFSPAPRLSVWEARRKRSPVAPPVPASEAGGAHAFAISGWADVSSAASSVMASEWRQMSRCNLQRLSSTRPSSLPEADMACMRV
mmetsp:Transcript_10661/g.30181  ORF Transcript_10661/g.30181 Transcript_10661/m.30181 type:complete len:230 (+) Transcript_10661:1421-2110(+)